MTVETITTSRIIPKVGPNKPIPIVTRATGVTIGVVVGDRVYARQASQPLGQWHEDILPANRVPRSKPFYYAGAIGERPEELRWLVTDTGGPPGSSVPGSISWEPQINDAPFLHNYRVYGLLTDTVIAGLADELGISRINYNARIGDVELVAGSPTLGNVRWTAMGERRRLSVYGAIGLASVGFERGLTLSSGVAAGLVNGAGASVTLSSLGAVGTPALGDMVTNGLSLTGADTTFVFAYTAASGSGIQAYSMPPVGSFVTDHGIIGWPAGRSLTGLGAVLVGWMPSNFAVILAVWNVAGRTIGHATKQNTDGSWSDWSQVWDESVNADLAYVAFDQYPHDNTLRMAASSFAPTSTTWLFTADASNIGAPPPPVNTAPNVPVWVTLDQSVPVNIALSMSWSFSDPDAGATQSAYEIRRDPVAAGATTYWTGSPGAWTTTSGASSKIAGAVTAATVENAVSASFAGAAYDFAVRVWDQGDLASGWSQNLRLTRQSVPPVVNLQTPVTGSTFNSGTIGFSWTVNQGTQASYQIRVFSGTDVTGTPLVDTGQVNSTATSASLFVPGEGLHTAAFAIFTSDNVASLPETTEFTITIPVPVTNSPPNAPALVSTSGPLPITSQAVIAWTFQDPDDGDTQQSYEIRRIRNSTQAFWRGSVGSWSGFSNADTKHSGSASSFAVDPATNHDAIGEVSSYYVRCWDQDDEVGPYSVPLTYTRQGVALQISIIEPMDGDTLNPGVYTFRWTPHAAQASYRLRVWAGTTTGGSPYIDTGNIVSPLSSRDVSIFNTGPQIADLSVFTSDGVESSAQVTFTVAEAPPPPPVNVAPTAPTLLSNSGNLALADSMVIAWQFNDPNPMDTQSAYEVRRFRNGNFRYWRGPVVGGWTPTQSAATKHSGNVMSATTEGPQGDGRLGQVTGLAVRTWDNNDVPGPFSATVTYTRVADALTATLIAPTDGQVLTSQDVTFSWTAQAGQASYRLRVYAGGGTSGPVLIDTGIVNSTSSSQVLSVPGAGTRTGRLEIYNGDGVASNSDTVTFSVALAPAGSGSFRTASDYASDLPNGRFNYWSSSPGNAAFTHVDIWRRVADSGSNGIRVAKNLPIPANWTIGEDWTDWVMAHNVDYEYQVVVHATGAPPTIGTWTRISTL